MIPYHLCASWHEAMAIRKSGTCCKKVALASEVSLIAAFVPVLTCYV